jgi:hypothetical protein
MKNQGEAIVKKYNLISNKFFCAWCYSVAPFIGEYICSRKLSSFDYTTYLTIQEARILL